MRSGFYWNKAIDRLLIRNFGYSCSVCSGAAKYSHCTLENITIESHYAGAVTEKYAIERILPKLNISLEKFKAMYYEVEKLCKAEQ